MSVQDVLTGIQNSTAATNAAKSADRMGNSTLDQDSFLQLMMAQLQYQDPLNPMDNSQMLTQQAQLTQVSELQKMNSNNGFVQANSFMGKNVAFYDPYNADQTVVGSVVQATVDKDGVTLSVTGINKDKDGNTIKDKDGKDIITTREFSMSDVMKTSGSITFAPTQTAATTDDTATTTN